MVRYKTEKKNSLTSLFHLKKRHMLITQFLDTIEVASIEVHLVVASTVVLVVLVVLVVVVVVVVVVDPNI